MFLAVKNFAIIAGNAEVHNGLIKYKVLNKFSKSAISEEMDLKREISYIKSDKSFSNGLVQFKVKFSNSKTGVYLVLKTPSSSNIHCGASYTDQRFTIMQEEKNSFTDLSRAGKLSKYPLNQEIIFQVQVLGSNVRLLIDNILMCEANVSIKEAPIEFKISAQGDIEIWDVLVSESRPKIFVVMQFTDEYNELYLNVIKPIVEVEFEYECIRADDFRSSSPILKDIVDSILNSKAIIAEITPDNPNVFYEIGYSHAIGKPTILLCDKTRSKLPFDLSGFRTLFYENTISGKAKIENSLRQYLGNL